VEPINDISVLGLLDNQTFPEEEQALGSFCHSIEPVSICRKELPSLSDTIKIEKGEIQTLTSEGKWIEKKVKVEVNERIHIYTHKRTWITGKAIHFFPFTQQSFFIEADKQIEGGKD
jgi:hypothetical protein